MQSDCHATDVARFSAVQVVATPSHNPLDPPGITGPERRAANLSGMWRTQGVDVTILYPRHGALWDTFSSSDANVAEFNLRGKWDIAAVNRLRDAITQTGAVVVHSQGGPALDIVAVLAARAAGAGVIITRPSMIDDNLAYGRSVRPLYNALDRLLVLRGADMTVAVSRDGVRRLSKYVPPSRLRLIYNGVDLKRFDVSALPSRHDGISGAIDIGMVGHLLPYKGWSDFLAVASKVSATGLKVRWHVVGEGSERAFLETEAQRLGLATAIKFHGLVKDVRSLLASWDIFLFTSHREGLSVAILEAMASGLPIVATHVGGILEQVDVKNGYVLPVRDVNALADRCIELTTNPNKRIHMGKHSRELAERHFSELSMFQGYLSLYRELASRHLSRART